MLPPALADARSLPDMLPDPAFYAECIEASFNELKTDVLGKPKVPKKAGGREKTARKRQAAATA